jgi:hypothetical protein
MEAGSMRVPGRFTIRKLRTAPSLWTLLIVLLACPPSHATVLRPLNLEEMTDRAEHIFSGRCVDVQAVRDLELEQWVTITTFVVERGVKGVSRETVTIRLLGGHEPERDRPRIRGMPRFHRGEEVILFLYGDSELGLTSPVGLGQGKFSVTRDKHGRSLAMNSTGNRNLLHGLSRGAERRLGPAAEVWKGRADLPPELLLDLVESLVRGSRQERRGQ